MRERTRRAYLSGTVGLLSVAAGCSSLSSSGETGSTPASTAGESGLSSTATGGASPAPDTAQSAFGIDRAALVYDYDDAGSIDRYQIESAGLDSTALLATETPLQITAEGTVDVETKTELLDGDTVIASSGDLSSTSVTVEDAEPGTVTTVSIPHSVDTAAAESTGDYTVRCTLRDVARDTDTAQATVPIELVEPLTADEVNLVGFAARDTVTVGEEFLIGLRFENTSDRDSTFNTQLSERRNDEAYRQLLEDGISLTIPSGGTNTWAAPGVTRDEPGV